MIRKEQKNTYFQHNSLSASRKTFRGNCDTHWHEFYEIEYVISGTGVCTLNGKPYPFEAGMLFFMTPADFHSVETTGADIINLMFLAELATNVHLAPFTSPSMPKEISIPLEMRPFLQILMEEIIAHQDNLTYCSALIDCLLLKILQSSEAFSSENTDTLSQQMQFYIINHFREDISLNDLAAQVNLTPSYTSAIFKREMQINFKGYLNDLRFDYARKLLLYSDMTIIQVCRESGFSDYPNFIRRFKEHFGMSPTQFREQLPESLEHIQQHFQEEE